MKIILRTLLLCSFLPLIAQPERPEYEKIETLYLQGYKKAKNNPVVKDWKAQHHQFLQNFQPLRDHVKNSSLETIQKSKSPITESTLLMMAIDLGDIEFIKILLAKGVDVNEEDRFCYNCILSTSINLRYELFTEIITLLLQHGANINHFDAYGNTLAHFVARELKTNNTVANPNQFEEKLEFLKQNDANFDLKNIYDVSVNDILKDE